MLFLMDEIKKFVSTGIGLRTDEFENVDVDLVFPLEHS